MTIEQTTTGRITPPSSTGSREPTVSVADRPPADMKARMWIGQNPVPFVVACLWVGYWVGRTTTGR